MSANILRIALQYSVYTGSIISCFGIIGNLINIIVFTSFKLFRSNRCGLFLTIEAVLGLVYAIYALTLSLIICIYQSDLLDRSLLWCRFRNTIATMCSVGTYSMICLEAAEQFFSTNYRFYIRNIFTITSVKWISAVTVALSMLHAGLTSLFFVIEPSVGCTTVNSVGIQYIVYFFYPILVGFLPIIISSSFSLLAFRNVRLIIRRQIPIQRRRFDQQITAMILARVACSTGFTLPFIIHQIVLFSNPLTPNDPYSYAIGQLIRRITLSIVAFVFSANFYIFVFSSPRYRRQVKYVLLRKSCQLIRKRFNKINNQIVPENLEIVD